MYLVFVVFVWVIFGILFVDWKNWEKYYPTIQYYLVLNLLYEFLYYNHPLWKFKAITTEFLNHTIINITFLFIVVPIAVLIFLQRFPKKRLNQMIYILVWSFFFFIIEYLFYLKGMFVYDNGWNIWHSLWFDVTMFIMFRLHYLKPLLTIGLTVIVVILFFVSFPVPFEKLN